jgi:hypothetical protein
MHFTFMILVVAILLSTALTGLIPAAQSFHPGDSISMLDVTPLDTIRHAPAAASANHTVHRQHHHSVNHTREQHHSIFENYATHVANADRNTHAPIGARSTLTWYAAVARDMHNVSVLFLSSLFIYAFEDSGEVV